MTEGPPEIPADAEELSPETLSATETLERDFDTELVPAVEELFEVANTVDGKIETASDELSPELKSRIEKLSKKARSFIHRLLYTATFATLAGSSVASAEQRKTEAPDSVIENQTTLEPKIEHADSITTHILNYFAGRDTLSEKEIETMFKHSLRAKLEERKVKIPQNFETMSYESAVIFATKETLNKDDDHQISYADEMKNFRTLPRFLGYKEGLLEAIWQIEIEAGSPQIRFIQNDDKLNLKSNFGRLGYYNPKTNTVALSSSILREYEQGESIDSDSSSVTLDVLSGELAHAKQWHTDRSSYNKAWHDDSKKVRKRAKEFGISRDSSQQQEYSTPGTYEHEAHSIIGPRIKQRFMDLADQFGKKVRIVVKE
jgi:hypothetical protein